MTTTCDLITPEQKEQYLRDGYCVIADLYTPQEIDEIEEFFEVTKAEDRAWYDWGKKRSEVDMTKGQVRAMHPHRSDAKAKAWAINPRIAAVLEELLGKPAGARGQGMHQDNIYLLSEPDTCIGTWTAIDNADLDNGCLWVVPGSNHYDILCPEAGTAREKTWLEYGDTNISKFPRDVKPIAVPVPRGSTMFFNGNLIHGSGPNRTTDRSRRTFIGHYIDNASVQVSKFYFPVMNMQGEVVTVAEATGGGPCGDGWQGAVH
jgi:ectoine hydroxylase-related dioxygenase (phytanoyl-CoA dioxygenase family)